MAYSIELNMDWKEAKEDYELFLNGELNSEDTEWLMKFLFEQHEAQGKYLNTGCPCGTCVPRPMLGMSWHKNLGFGSPNPCAEELYEQGHRYASHWYRGND